MDSSEETQEQPQNGLSDSLVEVPVVAEDEEGQEQKQETQPDQDQEESATTQTSTITGANEDWGVKAQKVVDTSWDKLPEGTRGKLTNLRVWADGKAKQFDRWGAQKFARQEADFKNSLNSANVPETDATATAATDSPARTEAEKVETEATASEDTTIVADE